MKSGSLILRLSLLFNLGLLVLALTWRSGTSGPESTSSENVPADSTLALAAAAGAPLPDIAQRYRTIGSALTRLQAAFAAEQPGPPPDSRYWHLADYYRNPYSLEQRARMAAAQREFASALLNLIGENVLPGAAEDPRRGILSPEKLNRLIGIEQLYDDAVAAINEISDRLILPSDELRLRELAAERDAAIAELLTPEEQEQLALRERRSGTAMGSVLAYTLQSIDNLEDYVTIRSLEDAFNEKYPVGSSPTQGISTLQASYNRRDAMPELLQSVIQALGPERVQALAWASDFDRRRLQNLETRLALPTGTAERAIDLRTRYAAESQTISRNTALTVDERRGQITALADRARMDLNSVLGTEGGSAYAGTASWIRYLSQGAPIAASPEEVPEAMTEWRAYPFGFNTVPLPIPGNTGPLLE